MQEDILENQEDVEILINKQDSLCPIVHVSLEERRGWCKRQKWFLIIKFVGKKMSSNFLKLIWRNYGVLKEACNLLMLGMIIM